MDSGYSAEHMGNPYFQLFIILLGAFMAVLDTSVVNVAIPAMESALNASTHSIQWVLTGYTLVLGILVPISGWLTDRLGPKKLFIFSLITFTIGSALCGISWNLPSMIFFRVIQAVGGGFMMPVAQTMIYRIFPPERRGVIMGLFGIVIMGAPAFGPLLSGYFVDYASWRLIFYINVPIGIIAVIMAVLALYEFPHATTYKLDYLGFIFSCIGFFSLLYGFSNVSDHGWKSWQVVLFILIGVVFIGLLVIQELTIEQPLIQLKILKNYMFSMSLVISGVIYVALFVGIFFLPIYLQNIRGYTALQTGEFMTPAAFGSAVMMLISGRLFNKLGPRILSGVGLVFVIYATYGFAHLGLNTTQGHIQTLYIVRSLGMGLAMMPITTAGMNDVPLTMLSQGSAISNTFRQVSASLGTAILTNYMSTRETAHNLHLASVITPFTPQGIQLNLLENEFIHQGMSYANAQMQAIIEVYKQMSEKSFVYGMNDTFFIASILTAVAWGMTMFFSNKNKKNVEQKKDTSEMVSLEI